jgi:hypothetical protein
MATDCQTHIWDIETTRWQKIGARTENASIEQMTWKLLFPYVQRMLPERLDSDKQRRPPFCSFGCSVAYYWKLLIHATNDDDDDDDLATDSA